MHVALIREDVDIQTIVKANLINAYFKGVTLGES